MHGRSRSRRRPRGDGTQGPRSSSKGKQWLSIQRISLGSAAALISNVSILPSIVLLCFVVALAGAASFSSHEFGMQHTFGGTTVPLAAVSVPTPALQSCGWLHFDFDSTLGFPGEGPPTFNCECCLEMVDTCQQVEEENEDWLQLLTSEKEQLEALRVVPA